MKIALLLLLAAVLPKAKAPYVIGDGTGGFYVSHVVDGTFKVARIRGDQWTATKTIATNASANAANFPSILMDGKRLLATWSTKHGSHGSLIHLAESSDGGATWKEAKTPHPKLVSEFGFVSLLPKGAVFLDGRALPGGIEGAGDMQLRTPDALLDSRVCDCCQTAAVMTSAGPLIAYRDRFDDETRDISVVRRTSKGWTKPKTLHPDGWQIQGCPVNGPQLDARGKRVVAAWFTAAQNDPRVLVAFSEDAGATFSKPVRVTAEKTTGRVDVAWMDADHAVVTYLAEGALHARRVSRKGAMAEPLRVGAAGGFPRVAISKENVGVVWTAEDGVHFQVLEGLK
ncbi:MAG TPA: sialidase family protein [Thermoanaerobaculia bacterium]|nr:sialidase family protein [Thermoanaerobaculia bacterium]